jgi:asparagine synthase (glutamine-hydrolysing)
MCGIVGGIGLSAPRGTLLDAQLKLIEHRGPDENGQYISDEVGLGICRLAIVEIASGKQPSSNSMGNIHLVFNGEIYNYRELRSDLNKRGVLFKSSSESEVIINLYIEFGIKFVEKLNGMFAIAIYDARDKTLHLIRDRMGKKPLWISSLSDGTLFFASEVKALMLARPDKTLRPHMVSEVMQYGYINSPNSAFNEINQVLPATIVSWKDRKVSTTVYWKPDFETKVEVTYIEALDTTKKIIESAVSRRLLTERPLGSFLSGGYDSTIVTAYMAKLLSEKVQTYSIGFDSLQFNEAHHARKIADFLGTNHHEEILKPISGLVIEEISQVLDQPFADSSIIPTYLLAKFARKEVIVALGGDGGDEVFGGYDRYIATPILQKLNRFLPLAKFGLVLLDRKILGSSKKINRASSQLSKKNSLAHRFSSIHSLVQSEDLKNIISPQFLYDSASNRFINDFDSNDLTTYDRMIRSDLSSYLPGDLLVKADMATMANSMELRSPMLDVNVVEWGISLPQKFKIKRLEGKHILKDVARSLVPEVLIDRPKMGFGIPRADWLRTGMKDLVMDTLTDTTARGRGWFDEFELKRLVTSHMDGTNYDNILWPILVLELWARNWLD